MTALCAVSQQRPRTDEGGRFRGRRGRSSSADFIVRVPGGNPNDIRTARGHGLQSPRYYSCPLQIAPGISDTSLRITSRSLRITSVSLHVTRPSLCITGVSLCGTGEALRGTRPSLCITGEALRGTGEALQIIYPNIIDFEVWGAIPWLLARKYGTSMLNYSRTSIHSLRPNPLTFTPTYG